MTEWLQWRTSIGLQKYSIRIEEKTKIHPEKNGWIDIGDLPERLHKRPPPIPDTSHTHVQEKIHVDQRDEAVMRK